MNLAVALLVMGAGATFAWVGIKNPPGGVAAVASSVLHGQGTGLASSTTAPPAPSSTGKP